MRTLTSLILSFSLMVTASSSFAQSETETVIAPVPISARATVCQQALSDAQHGAVSTVITSGAGYAAYRLWRRGGRRLLTTTLRRFVSVGSGLLTLAGASYSYFNLTSAVAIMELCTADTLELQRLDEMTHAGLLGSESLAIKTLIATYGVNQVHNMIASLLESDMALMQQGLMNFLVRPLTEEELNSLPEEGEEFELPSEGHEIAI